MKKLIQALMVILILVLPLFAQIPTNGLTHAYFMNGSGKDASGKGHDLWEMARRDTVDRKGTPNSAVSLNGVNQAFRLPDSTLPCTGAPFTVSLWASNSSENVPVLVSWGAYISGKFFKIAISAGGTDIIVTNGVDTLMNRLYKPYDKYLAWFPVTVSYNGTTTDLYIGDSLVKSKNMKFNIEKGGFLGIGCQFVSYAGKIDLFKGSLDCILIYNRPLIRKEVSYLLNCSEKLNSAPILTLKSIDSTKVGENYIYVLKGTDIDNQILTYKLILGPTGMTLNTNTINWNPSIGGNFEVSVSVTDGIDTTTQKYKIIVLTPVSITKTKINKSINKSINLRGFNNKQLNYTINGRCTHNDLLNQSRISNGIRIITLK